MLQQYFARRLLIDRYVGFGKAMTLAAVLIWSLSALVMLLTVYLSLQIVMALSSRPASRETRLHDRRPRVAVIVPAHNESSGILATLLDIRSQLADGDRLLVVADNCTDDTAARAAIERVEVLVRQDADRRGKGYALDFGLKHLAHVPPEIVIIIDADCRLGPDTIAELAVTCARTNRPVQALDLMLARGEALSARIAEFTWRLRNWVRPLGLGAIGLPCHLMGTGMAFSWDMLRTADLHHGDITEDLRLGTELAIMGYSPLFHPQAAVTSYFPSTDAAAKAQRTRWEHGHLDLIVRRVPALVREAVLRRRLDLLLVALDLAIPPLTLLFVLQVFVLAASALFFLLGGSAVILLVNLAGLLVFCASVVLAWGRFGRDLFSLGALLSLPFRMMRKLPMYAGIMMGTQARVWSRTSRHDEELTQGAQSGLANDRVSSKVAGKTAP